MGMKCADLMLDIDLSFAYDTRAVALAGRYLSADRA